MIHFLLDGARKVDMTDEVSESWQKWWVMHPENEAVLAYCDTEKEADAVIAGLQSLASLFEK